MRMKKKTKAGKLLTLILAAALAAVAWALADNIQKKINTAGGKVDGIKEILG